MDDLLAEAHLRAPRSPRTVYLGGGTPSYLPPAELRRLLDGLDEVTGFRDSATEVSAECNPESLNPETAETLVSGGVTRLSIGFQSLSPSLLKFLGRPHGRDQALAAFAAARAAGPRSVGIDLIYAIPGLTTEAWAADLADVLALGPDHLSAYALTWEEGTPLAARQGTPGYEPATEETELEQMALTRQMARDAGLYPYEVSNYARSGHECSHNVNYWENGFYIGLGPSAVSRFGPVRWGNPRSLTTWSRILRDPSQSVVGSGATPPAWHERLDPCARLGESWWLGLRLARGVDPAALRERSGFDGSEADDPCLPTARRLLGLDLLEEAQGRIRLTESGLPVADAIGREFLVPSP